MVTMLPWLDTDSPFPSTSQAWPADSEAPGLLAAGADLSPARLEAAYRRGIFPWFSAGQPVLWWSPDPRMVLPVQDLKISRSLRKTLRKFIRTPGCEVRMDSAFDEVMGHCAQRQGISGRQGSGTWIVPEMRQAYGQWHRMGRVHSVETWIQGRLVGGLYVVELGKMVFGESMFSLQPDASKIALCALVAKCRAEDIRLIDCQQNTSHLASLGAREISRLQFESHLRDAIGPVDTNTSRISPPWSYDVGLWDLLDRDDE